MAGGKIKLSENSGGVDTVGFAAPENVTGDLIWTLPSADGDSGQVLSTNGSQVLGWQDPDSGPKGETGATGEAGSGWKVVTNPSNVPYPSVIGDLLQVACDGVQIPDSNWNPVDIPKGSIVKGINTVMGLMWDTVPQMNILGETGAQGETGAAGPSTHISTTSPTGWTPYTFPNASTASPGYIVGDCWFDSTGTWGQQGATGGGVLWICNRVAGMSYWAGVGFYGYSA